MCNSIFHAFEATPQCTPLAAKGQASVGLDGQLLKGGHVLYEQGRTTKRGKALLAKIGEGTTDSLTRHADDLPDLFVGQGYFDSATGDHPAILVRPIQHQAGDALRRRVLDEGAKMLVRLLAIAA